MNFWEKTSNKHCELIMFYLSGMYCGSEGLADVTGPCDPGYYCPAGQVSATPANFSCQPGYFCVGGKSAPESCPSGSYQVRARFATDCQFLQVLSLNINNNQCIVCGPAFIFVNKLLCCKFMYQYFLFPICMICSI